MRRVIDPPQSPQFAAQQPAEQEREAARQQLEQERESARDSRVFFGGTSGSKVPSTVALPLGAEIVRLRLRLHPRHRPTAAMPFSIALRIDVRFRPAGWPRLPMLTSCKSAASFRLG